MRLKNRETSKYLTAVEVPVVKRLLTSFLDILMCFILTICIFSITNLILGSMSVYTSTAELASTLQDELYELVEESGLSKRDEDDDMLFSQEESAENYILSATLLILEENISSDEISNTIYQDVTSLDKTNDGLYHYNVVFKNENQSSFTSATFYDEESYYQRLTSSVSDRYETRDGLPVFTLETAIAINNYYISNSTSGYEIYSEIKSNYLTLLDEDITEFTTSYQPYVEKEEDFMEATYSQLNMTGIAILLSFVLSVLVLFVLLPLIFKDGKTLSMKILSLAYCDVNGYEFSVLNLLLRLVFTFISMMFIPFLSGLLIYGYEGAYFMEINVLGFFNFFTAFIVSVVYLMISSIVSLIKRKKGRQSLTDILSLVYLKNTKEYKEDEVIHFNNGKSK